MNFFLAQRVCHGNGKWIKFNWKFSRKFLIYQRRIGCSDMINIESKLEKFRSILYVFSLFYVRRRRPKLVVAPDRKKTEEEINLRNSLVNRLHAMGSVRLGIKFFFLWYFECGDNMWKGEQIHITVVEHTCVRCVSTQVGPEFKHL